MYWTPKFHKWHFQENKNLTSSSSKRMSRTSTMWIALPMLGSWNNPVTCARARRYEINWFLYSRTGLQRENVTFTSSILSILGSGVWVLFWGLNLQCTSLKVYWNTTDVRTFAKGSSAKWVTIQDLAKVTKIKSKSTHRIISCAFPLQNNAPVLDLPPSLLAQPLQSSWKTLAEKNVTSRVTQRWWRGPLRVPKKWHIKSFCSDLIGISFCHNKAKRSQC